ncbi:3-phosphoshikimate 1-carboxyvinyltransferase [Desulfovibrio inopinatus]|uniref:3-phosphoshikimate 1-carboxyvinyltransferase n=1 Tax=Desulfovibrio inopinatus TaxID=102109 RepID=UPI000421D846|nr:3-phosphoshikimate 1-carboxyvinyltransferase [Desulfovibrio inopinatus]
MFTIDIQAPASKSVSHRTCIAAAMAEGQSQISGVLESNDLIATRACLGAAGAVFEGEDGAYTVTGVAGVPQGGTDEPANLDMNESGTSCRLLTAIVAAGRGSFLVHGRGRLHDRPIGDLANALTKLGVTVHWREKVGCPPLVIETSGLSAGTTSISLEESSQYLSGLLMAAPMAAGPVTIEVTGKKVVSWPYVALSLMVMDDFGIDFSVEGKTDTGFMPLDWRALETVVPGQIRFQVKPSVYTARTYVVEGDWSNASYFLAAGALGKHPVRVNGLRRDSLQGDKSILDILSTMGATVEWNDTGDAVTVTAEKLHGAELDMGHCPDLVPTVAMAASQASSQTTIRNVAHLRIKESDRLEAVANEISKLGVPVQTFDDGLTVTPSGDVSGTSYDFCTYDDHRLAMSISLLELAGVNVRLDNPKCVDKSFPEFFTRWDVIRRANVD